MPITILFAYHPLVLCSSGGRGGSRVVTKYFGSTEEGADGLQLPLKATAVEASTMKPKFLSVPSTSPPAPPPFMEIHCSRHSQWLLLCKSISHYLVHSSASLRTRLARLF